MLELGPDLSQLFSFPLEAFELLFDIVNPVVTRFRWNVNCVIGPVSAEGMVMALAARGDRLWSIEVVSRRLHILVSTVLVRVL